MSVIRTPKRNRCDRESHTSHREHRRWIFLLTSRDDLQKVVRQRLLQLQSIWRFAFEPKIDLLRRRQDDRHSFGMNRGATMALASVVRKPNSSCSPSTGALLVPRIPRHGVHTPAKANKGRPSAMANQVGILRGFPSAYSQNAVAGTMQRFFGDSQPCQCGLETLRMFVTGTPPYCTGPGIPQRASTSSRLPPSALRTIGAIWSGKMPGKEGRLPVRSCCTRNSPRIAAWPLVSE